MYYIEITLRDDNPLYYETNEPPTMRTQRYEKHGNEKINPQGFITIISDGFYLEKNITSTQYMGIRRKMVDNGTKINKEKFNKMLDNISKI